MCYYLLSYDWSYRREHCCRPCLSERLHAVRCQTPVGTTENNHYQMLKCWCLECMRWFCVNVCGDLQKHDADSADCLHYRMSLRHPLDVVQLLQWPSCQTSQQQPPWQWKTTLLQCKMQLQSVHFHAVSNFKFRRHITFTQQGHRLLHSNCYVTHNLKRWHKKIRWGGRIDPHIAVINFPVSLKKSYNLLS